MKNRLGERFTLLFEGAAHLLDAATGFGLVSGAAVAVAIGQFLLGGILALLAVGAILRFKRGRVSR